MKLNKELMKLNKEEFLGSDFGIELIACVKLLDEYLTEKDKEKILYEAYSDAFWHVCIYSRKWDVFKLALLHFFGVEYCFVRTDDYYGVCTADESDWLLKRSRDGKKMS